MVPGPRAPGSHDGSKCCRFLWSFLWLRGHTVFLLHGNCRSCGVPGVALRTQVSMDLWGSPGASAGASLVRAGAEVSRSHLALSLWPCPALPSLWVLCLPRESAGAALPGRTLDGRGLPLSSQGPTGDCSQEPPNPITLRIPKASALEVS